MVGFDFHAGVRAGGRIHADDFHLIAARCVFHKEVVKDYGGNGYQKAGVQTRAAYQYGEPGGFKSRSGLCKIGSRASHWSADKIGTEEIAHVVEHH
ncbi:hypothetical protein SDC9_128376 [bioreactor metagenome]|uniref:Uncharacterized protein n=1 Tax=bioreactor metagenome TaxID=1076179 RepID=A0A645CWM2_9ZZZZ